MLPLGPIITVFLPTLGALLGSITGALVTYRASERASRMDRLKLISSWTKSEELERVRIAAYRELWRCLGGISTHRPNEIVGKLASVQDCMQKWYYEGGGGLFLTGAVEKGGSTKASFFAARDLRSSDPSEIWHVFHSLRRSVRQDLGVFESEADETAALDSVRKKFGNYER